MNADDGIRARRGVVACVRELADGRVGLIFDDVEADSAVRPTTWQPIAFFTSTQLDAAKLKNLELSEKQLAEIGFNLLARLRATADA
jgi:hypothetical protein